MFILATWVFIEVADDAPEGDYLEWENQILLSLRQADDLTLTRGPWWLAEAARDVTALGSAVVLTLLTGIVVGFLAMRRRLRTAALVLLATFGGYLLSSGFKSHFGRDRPDVVPHLTEELSLSFPSGHSMVSSATYLTLGALLAQTLARRRERIYFIATALALTGLIGASRVYLGVHYPTDVVAGWAGGTAWAILCWGVAFWLQRRGAIRTPPQEDAAATAAEPAGTR
ncbi:MAG TPA: phosphatase PAP2 family protein [Candidatus Synoicihabitans sp.]|nr:phosphatase PAP2 family protein [Candidatus Synoicihabitans sp.]